MHLRKTSGELCHFLQTNLLTRLTLKSQIWRDICKLESLVSLALLLAISVTGFKNKRPACSEKDTSINMLMMYI